MPMDSDSDSEDFAQYGSPLEPLDEDGIIRERKQDQTVRDKYGRQRFHGAFTGGFSAGFFNTVGSLEGWAPSSFKSSRSEKAGKRLQKPEDFMDDEDFSEFGIAPKRLRAKSDFFDNTETNKKYHDTVLQTSTIPGEPVLEKFIRTAIETVGMELLKKMGWKPGQGVGPRLTRHEKKRKKRFRSVNESSKKMYGCSLPPTEVGSDSDDSASDSRITFAPDDVEEIVCIPKNDTFGIGYKGLDNTVLCSQHINLFEPSPLVVEEKGKNRLQISGQAFGVGALEDDDEDIYQKEDMSQYDFALEAANEQPKQPSVSRISANYAGEVLPGFCLPTVTHAVYRKRYNCPPIPPGFQSKHSKSTRFGWTKRATAEHLKIGQIHCRHSLDATSRGEILSSGEASRSTEEIGVSSGGQQEQLTEWEKEHKRIEDQRETGDQQDRTNELESRFVRGSILDDTNNEIPVPNTYSTQDDQKTAAKMKMFGKLTRERVEWYPSNLLCKRFNVPNPKQGMSCAPTRTKAKHNVFDYLNAFSHNIMFQPAQQNTETSVTETVGLSHTGERKESEKQPEDTVNDGSVKEDLVDVDSENRAVSESDDDAIVFLDPPQKIDLYKAIFLSSSESENDSDHETSSKQEKVEEQQTEELIPINRSNVSDSTTFGDSQDNSNFAAIEKERNSSPPRGIFANIDFDALNSRTRDKVVGEESVRSSNQEASVSTNKNDRDSDTQYSNMEDDTYGPPLPPGIIPTIGKVDDLPSKGRPSGTSLTLTDISDGVQWVEKSAKSQSKHKKSKKKRKSKKKHKHKHKHSKKRKRLEDSDSGSRSESSSD